MVWYRIVLPEVETDKGARLLLHFGAVDRIADVWVDGTHVGRHEGGQTAFTFDITEALGDGRVADVRAEDDPHDPSIPRGKQDWHEQPHSIWYHRVTGIWRSCGSRWCRICTWSTPSGPPTLSRARITGAITLSRSADASVEVLASLEGATLGRVRDRHRDTDRRDRPAGRGAAQRPGARGVRCGLPSILASSTSRSLSVKAAMVADEVACYAGMRSVAVDEHCLMLNDRPVPVGRCCSRATGRRPHFTPPSPEAIREEVELILRLGFNSVRIHQKVEDAALPLLVRPSGTDGMARGGIRLRILRARRGALHRRLAADRARAPLSPEHHRVGALQRVMGHPARRPGSGAASYSRGLTELTRALDVTRPVISNDGWEHTASDIVTVHDYDPSGEALGRRYASAHGVAAVVDSRGPHGRKVALRPHAGRPVMVTEFGGVRYDVTPGSAEGWGYSSEASSDAFEQRLSGLVGAMHDSSSLAGFCYTQLTDTRQERNGLCDAHRTPKLPVDVLHGIITGTRARDRVVSETADL